MKKVVFVFCTLLFLFSSCKKGKSDLEKVYPDNEKKVTIQQGVWGTVFFMEGDCMPGTGRNSCSQRQVIRQVKIYQKTKISDVIDYKWEEPTFYLRFSTSLIKEVRSDEQGFFQADLPIGEYTLVVEENGKLYANRFDIIGPDQFINVFSIESGKVSKVDFSINYKAVY